MRNVGNAFCFLSWKSRKKFQLHGLFSWFNNMQFCENDTCMHVMSKYLAVVFVFHVHGDIMYIGCECTTWL